MGVIKRKDLVAKNKAGTGIRQKENNDAIKALAGILEKVGKEYEAEALELSCNTWARALRYLTDNRISSNNQGQIDIALRDLSHLEETLVYQDVNTGRTTYDDIVRVLPNVGSSKEEFDRLLGTANTVLEFGLEKSILDPQAQARARQEQERRRQEQERQRQERERQRQEQERQEARCDLLHRFLHLIPSFPSVRVCIRSLSFPADHSSTEMSRRQLYRTVSGVATKEWVVPVAPSTSTQPFPSPRSTCHW